MRPLPRPHSERVDAVAPSRRPCVTGVAQVLEKVAADKLAAAAAAQAAEDAAAAAEAEAAAAEAALAEAEAEAAAEAEATAKAEADAAARKAAMTQLVSPRRERL